MTRTEKKALFFELWNRIYDAQTEEELDKICDEIDDIEAARLLPKKAIQQLNDDEFDRRMLILEKEARP